jgi:hypothetical protein
MARALGIDGTRSLSDALTAVAASRPLCLTPAMGLGGMPAMHWTPIRLVRVNAAGDAAPATPLTLTSLIVDISDGGSIWTSDVLAIYGAAARHNDLLCQSLAPVAGSLPAGACEK